MMGSDSLLCALWKDLSNVFPHRLINIFECRLGDITFKPKFIIGMPQFFGLVKEAVK